MENIPDIPTKTIIVVACVCALVILILLAVLLYFCCKRRQPRKSDFEANPPHVLVSRYYNEVLPMLEQHDERDSCSTASQDPILARQNLATISRRRPQAMAVQYPGGSPQHNASANSLTTGKPYAMVPPSGHRDSPPPPPGVDQMDGAAVSAKPVFATSQSSKDPLLASMAGDSSSDPPSPRRLVSSFASSGTRPTSNASAEGLRLLSAKPAQAGTDNQSMDLQMTPLTADSRALSPTPNGDGWKPRKVIYEVVV